MSARMFANHLPTKDPSKPKSRAPYSFAHVFLRWPSAVQLCTEIVPGQINFCQVKQFQSMYLKNKRRTLIA